MQDTITSVPTRPELLAFLRQHRYAVQASVARAGGVQAAVVGIAVSDQFEIVFDTLESTRKAQNLRADSHIAFVIGGLTDGEERTVQYEGLAEVPGDAELASVRELYFRTFPDGRERLAWPGIMHWRVRPLWLRYSDFGKAPPVTAEFDARALAGLR